MLHGILAGASEWALFTRIDASIAEAFREAGCGRCGGQLHVADYARKPRGLGFSRGEGFTRFSFCCGSEGCRRRSTPPSVVVFWIESEWISRIISCGLRRFVPRCSVFPEGIW